MNLMELSKALQKNPATIMAGLKQGVFPFATAECIQGTGKRATVITYPALLQEYVTGCKGEYDLSLKAVAERLDMSVITVQVLLQLGKLPIGVAYKTKPTNKQFTYVIFPAKYEKYLVKEVAA